MITSTRQNNTSFITLLCLLQLLLAGCSSNRFIDWHRQTDKIVAIPSLSDSQIKQLHQVSVQAQTQSQTQLFSMCTAPKKNTPIQMTLVSCHQWLKHNAETRYTESQAKIIPHYNAALLQILTSQSDLISL